MIASSEELTSSIEGCPLTSIQWNAEKACSRKLISRKVNKTRTPGAPVLRGFRHRRLGHGCFGRGTGPFTWGFFGRSRLGYALCWLCLVLPLLDDGLGEDPEAENRVADHQGQHRVLHPVLQPWTSHQ